MSKLLLFSLLVLGTAVFAQAADSSTAPAPDEPLAAPATSFSGTAQQFSFSGDNQTGISDQDRTCLRIHAFIFKTEDDRVPRLVRETTCMPATGIAAKKVKGHVQPKLIPATGGNSF